MSTGARELIKKIQESRGEVDQDISRLEIQANDGSRQIVSCGGDLIGFECGTVHKKVSNTAALKYVIKHF